MRVEGLGFRVFGWVNLFLSAPPEAWVLDVSETRSPGCLEVGKKLRFHAESSGAAASPLHPSGSHAGSPKLEAPSDHHGGELGQGTGVTEVGTIPVLPDGPRACGSHCDQRSSPGT